MKTFILTTAIVFALIFAAHVARLFAEGLHLIREPVFAFTSLLSIVLAAWAWHLFRRLSRSDENA